MSDRIRRQHRYTITPEHLILDPRVGDRAFRLWCRLDRYAADSGSAFPYRESLSVELDCSLASVDRALAELVDAGWMTKRLIAGDRCEYTLIVVPEGEVAELVAEARAARRERWGQQRTRQRRATRERQSTPGVVTGEDTGVVMGEDTSVVTHDEGVSSPMTACVVTGDAQKDASRSDASLKESLSPPLRSGDPATGPQDDTTNHAEESLGALLELPSPAKGRPGQGTRIPDGWQPSPALLAWAASNAPHVNAVNETETFRDYWTARAGAAARKADWAATWRVWMRRASQDNARRIGITRTTTNQQQSSRVPAGDAWRRNLA